MDYGPWTVDDKEKKMFKPRVIILVTINKKLSSPLQFGCD
jgi:hypothetical protein